MAFAPVWLATAALLVWTGPVSHSEIQPPPPARPTSTVPAPAAALAAALAAPPPPTAGTAGTDGTAETAGLATPAVPSTAVKPAGIALPDVVTGSPGGTPDVVLSVPTGAAPTREGPGKVLSDSRMLFASTNLLHSDLEQRQSAARDAEIAAFQRRLDSARSLRNAKLFEEATPHYAAVLTGNAPEEMKQGAMLELALMAQEQNNLARALQVLSQYLTRWPQDVSVPEILLRQGLIYRQLGMQNLAMAKFYATMTSALVVKSDQFDYYRRLVLQAQAEIAETLAQQNLHAEAAAAFARLLKEESPALNRPRVQHRYIQSLAAVGRHSETIGQAQDFLAKYASTSEEQAEVRFFLAGALKQLGRNNEALQEVLKLLQSQQSLARERPETLAYWQQRTGNEIANHLYKEGNFFPALEIYQSLLTLNPSPAWQCPIRYQIGLAYERLEQPAKAADAYGSILALEKEIGTNAPPGLNATLDMARWRQSHLQWQQKTEIAQRDLRSILAPAPGVADPAPNQL